MSPRLVVKLFRTHCTCVSVHVCASQEKYRAVTLPVYDIPSDRQRSCSHDELRPFTVQITFRAWKVESERVKVTPVCLNRPDPAARVLALNFEKREGSFRR